MRVRSCVGEVGKKFRAISQLRRARLLLATIRRAPSAKLTFLFTPRFTRRNYADDMRYEVILRHARVFLLLLREAFLSISWRLRRRGTTFVHISSSLQEEGNITMHSRADEASHVSEDPKQRVSSNNTVTREGKKPLRPESRPKCRLETHRVHDRRAPCEQTDTVRKFLRCFLRR